MFKMKYDPTMIRGITVIKNIWYFVVPALLSGILAFQILKCQNILDRRNSYLLENLPSNTNWVWDAFSGSLYPYLYAEDDQPGGILAKRQNPFAAPADADSNKFDYQSAKAKWQENMDDYQKDYRESVLLPGMPSFTVHYLWCFDGHFEINHYITILSALHQLRPDKMIIHYLVKPRTDPHGYWRWLEDLQRDIVMLSLRPLQNSQHCSHEFSAGVKEEDFPDAHGVFLLGDVAITNLTRPGIVSLMAKSFLEKTSGTIQVDNLVENKWSQSQVFIVSNTEPFHISQSPGRTVIACHPVSEFNNVKNLKDASCVSMQSYFYPEELLNKDTRFFRFARTLLYGSPKPKENQVGSPTTTIPNIFHIILEEDSPMITPLLYVSIKSAYLNGKIDTVFVHCNKKPSGELWERLFYSDHLSPIVVSTGSFMAEATTMHTPMIYMLYTLLQHGGIASFGDLIFVKPWQSFPSHSAPAVISLHRSQYRQQHRTLNTAVLAAAPGSKFIHEMLGIIHQSCTSWPKIIPDDIATHLSEVNPNSVVVDSQLTSHQECDGSRCLIAGGHDTPQMVHTTRLIWKSDEPGTVEELSAVQGPFAKEIHSLIKP